MYKSEFKQKAWSLPVADLLYVGKSTNRKLALFGSGGCERAHPPGVAPEASEEWFDSSEDLMLFVMPRPAWLFPHAAWP